MGPRGRNNHRFVVQINTAKIQLSGFIRPVVYIQGDTIQLDGQFLASTIIWLVLVVKNMEEQIGYTKYHKFRIFDVFNRPGEA